ncbi:MAG: C1 family peptidase [Kiritimatiellae bacterium]|nr:C1 family peptidase [Kiritimatiellia bacterium]
MAESSHIFSPFQAEYLRAMQDGRYRAPSRRPPASVSLVDRMPPVVYQQALRGTCVANAVTALLEYYGDCKTRLSVQYLYSVTKEIEREGLERNLAHVRTGEPLDHGFESALHAQLQQLRLLANANGGMDALAVQPYLQRFEDGVRARFDEDGGSLMRSCFKAVETKGVCRHALWPYAAAAATPVFGKPEAVVFPPGTHEDAQKRRVLSGLYLLGTPNNVDEIRGILAGVNGRRPMPVCVTVDIFEGCDDGTFAFPPTREVDGALASDVPWQGRHGLLLAGYVDEAAYAGGGYFIVRNSYGEDWGEGGYGKMPYAYLECFALEAGTILQNMVDYAGDGYDGMRTVYDIDGRVLANRAGRNRPSRKMRSYMWVNALAAVVLVACTWLAAHWLLRPERKPFVEVTVYGTGGMNEEGVLPHWNVKGQPIDGGYVYTLPAKDRKAVDEIRTALGRMETLHEKRGKPLTYDLISLFLLKGDDRAAVKRAISEFMGEGFPVRIREDGPAGLKVATLNPRGLKAKLSRVFSVEDEENDTLWLKPHVMK